MGEFNYTGTSTLRTAASFPVRADNMQQLTDEWNDSLLLCWSIPGSGVNIVSGNIQTIIKLLGILVSCRSVKWVRNKLFKNLQILLQVGFLKLCFNHDRQ